MARNTKIGLKVSANSADGKMTFALVKGNSTVASMIIDASQASSVAAMALATAKKAHDLSGKSRPPSTKNRPVDLTAVPCSGWNIGPGQSPKSVMLMFHFGETTLGISIPQEHAQLLAQRLMTAAATGTAQ